MAIRCPKLRRRGGLLRRPTIFDRLRHVRVVGRMGVVRFVPILDCEYLDRLGDVFQFLQTEGPETESKLSADLIINGAGY